MNKLLSKKLILLVLYVILLIGACYVIYYFNLTYGIGLICVLNKITGLYCPGCGMTRAVLSLFSLDVYQAFRYNAFSVLLMPIFVVYLMGAVYGWLCGKGNYFSKKIPNSFWIVIATVMIIYGVLRNIPYFSYLAPTVVR